VESWEVPFTETVVGLAASVQFNVKGLALGEGVGVAVGLAVPFIVICEGVVLLRTFSVAVSLEPSDLI
jgi:hypothetical protein